MKSILIFSLLASFIMLPACSPAGEKVERNIKGYIVTIGNEPFTNLALQVEDNEIYVLKVENEEQKSELQKNQGKYYIISYESAKSYISGDTILVKKVEPAY